MTKLENSSRINKAVRGVEVAEVVMVEEEAIEGEVRAGVGEGEEGGHAEVVEHIILISTKPPNETHCT